MKHFFIYESGVEAGPFTIEELAEKKITRDTPVWYEGLHEWTAAENVDHLKPLFAMVPPPYKPKVENEVPKEEPLPKQESDLNDSGLGVYFARKERRNKRKRRGLLLGLIIFIIALLIAVPKIKREYDKSEFRSYTSRYIRVGNESYKYNPILGGISDLHFTVFNNSDFKTNYVTVTVYYIRKNGQTYKTESVTVEDVYPHSEQTVTAPGSSAGMSVVVKLENVVCYEAGLYY